MLKIFTALSVFRSHPDSHSSKLSPFIDPMVGGGWRKYLQALASLWQCRCRGLRNTQLMCACATLGHCNLLR